MIDNRANLGAFMDTHAKNTRPFQFNPLADYRANFPINSHQPTPYNYGQSRLAHRYGPQTSNYSQGQSTSATHGQAFTSNAADITRIQHEETNWLRVQPAEPDEKHNEPRINHLSEAAVKRLSRSKGIFVFAASRADMTPTLVQCEKVPLKALAVISPVVNASLHLHNQRVGSTVEHVILPVGNLRAYKELCIWVSEIIKAGGLVVLRTILTRPLFTYANLVKIAGVLRISYLSLGLRRRVEGMLTIRQGQYFTLHPGDIKEAWANFAIGHWLRRGIVRAIVEAEISGSLHLSFAIKLDELYSEIPSFATEVAQAKAEIFGTRCS